jgi:hypothetical protein
MQCKVDHMRMISLVQGALKVSMLSPGFIYEPYAPREPISFWKRLDLNKF